MKPQKMTTMTNLLKAFLQTAKTDFCDVIAAAKYVWNGPKLDPKRFAETPPDWWFQVKPVAKAPRKMRLETEWQEVRYNGSEYEMIETDFTIAEE